jgi:hypothetical protein
MSRRKVRQKLKRKKQDKKALTVIGGIFLAALAIFMVMMLIRG